MIRISAILLLATVLTTGCATTNLPPVTSDRYQQLPDEKRIWIKSEQEQQVLADSEMEFDNKKLSTYINDIAMAVLPVDAGKKIKVEIVIINNPYSNAFAYANGKVYVHTGILARMENEAQLATLLGHEMTHVTHRHQVRERRSIRNKAAGMASFRATLGSIPLVGELSSALGELGTMAAVSGYSKDLETEADDIGLEWMMAAGYDPNEAPKLFEHLMKEMKEEGGDEPFFFGSHPKLKNRHANYTSALKKLGAKAKGKKNQKRFEKAIAQAIYETARLDLQAGRFVKSENGIKRYLKIYPNSSKAHYLLGEVCRQRNEEGDYEIAIKHLSRASKLNNKHADSFRSLGLVYMNKNKNKAARKAFQSYLKRAPHAEDRGFIKEYIHSLK